MLRVSGQASGEETDLSAIRDGVESAGASGVAHADLLVSFADAVVAHDDAAIAELRPKIIEAVGPDGFLETASVAANFQRMVRIADSTGIPQDAPVRALASDLIEDLNLRDFPSANNTPPASLVHRVFGTLLRPFAAKLMSAGSRRMGG